jgi:phospholipase C
LFFQFFSILPLYRINNLRVFNAISCWILLLTRARPTRVLQFRDPNSLRLTHPPYEEFLLAAGTGTLPAVSFIDPRYTILDDGTGNDDHPHADIRKGDLFLYETFHAVARGPKWANTVFIVNFDEWGGFFEHIATSRST